MRRWLCSMLPECPGLAEVLSAGSEVAANAIQHTLTGQGGWLDVEVTVHDRSSFAWRSPTTVAMACPRSLMHLTASVGGGCWSFGCCRLDAGTRPVAGCEAWAEIPWEGTPVVVPDYLADADGEYVPDRSVADHRRADAPSKEVGAP